MTRIKAVFPDIHSQTTEIFIDDKPLIGVTSFKFEAAVGKLNRITLHLIAEVELEGEAKVEKYTTLPKRHKNLAWYNYSYLRHIWGRCLSWFKHSKMDMAFRASDSSSGTKETKDVFTE